MNGMLLPVLCCSGAMRDAFNDAPYMQQVPLQRMLSLLITHVLPL
jgi:hypothetical protein